MKLFYKVAACLLLVLISFVSSVVIFQVIDLVANAPQVAPK